MSRVLIAITGFLVGGAIVTGTAVALDRSSARAVASTTMAATMGTAATPSAITKLTIQHVQRGCHVWSYGSRQGASMRLSLDRGARLQLLDQDIDPHGLVQLSGPKLRIHRHMMMGETQLITFKQPGLYRLKNKVIEMGPAMDVKTIGPDNTLRLTVFVR